MSDPYLYRGAILNQHGLFKANSICGTETVEAAPESRGMGEERPEETLLAGECGGRT